MGTWINQWKCIGWEPVVLDWIFLPTKELMIIEFLSYARPGLRAVVQWQAREERFFSIWSVDCSSLENRCKLVGERCANWGKICEGDKQGAKKLTTHG